MLENYDFSKGVKNPYSARLKKQVTISLDADVAEYFKKQAEETGIPYQKLVSFYLADCAKRASIWNGLKHHCPAQGIFSLKGTLLEERIILLVYQQRLKAEGFPPPFNVGQAVIPNDKLPPDGRQKKHALCLYFVT